MSGGASDSDQDSESLGTEATRMPTKTVDMCVELECVTIARNGRHFAQSYTIKTLFIIFPHSDTKGETKLNVQLDKNRNETTMPGNMFLETKLTFEELKDGKATEAEMKEEEVRIQFKDFVYGFCKWDGKTSTLHSRRH